MKFKNNLKLVFLIGPPASGKDTQGKLLAKKLKAKFVATSDLIRNFFSQTKKRYLKIKNKIFDLRKEEEKLKKGLLVDAVLTSYIVLKRIKEALAKKEILVISGSPRRIFEAKEEFYFLKKSYLGNFIFIYLDVPQKEIYKRCLKRQREDDRPEVIKTRIENYKKETLPALNFLKEKSSLIKINGQGKVLKIHQEILKKLNLAFRH